jgi:hypothetical protein
MCITRSGTVRLQDEHAHVQRLVSVIKMATVLEEYTTYVQRSVVLFICGRKSSMQRIFIKTIYPFTV